MKLKNLELYYVGNLIMPMSVTRTMTTCFEESNVLKNRIMKRKKEEDIYFDLEKSRDYKVTNELGIPRIEVDSIEPLKNYYTVFGFPKLTKTSISVNKKVKKLKKKNKL